MFPWAVNVLRAQLGCSEQLASLQEPPETPFMNHQGSSAQPGIAALEHVEKPSCARTQPLRQFKAGLASEGYSLW